MRYTPTLYDETLEKIRRASHEGDADHAIRELTNLGFETSPPTDPKFMSGYVCREG
jgi:hypothetical protein